MLAKGIERIHRANLINFCIVPIVFADPSDYDRINQGDTLVIEDLRRAVEALDLVRIAKADGTFELKGRLELSPRDRAILLAGGLLSFTRGQSGHQDRT